MRQNWITDIAGAFTGLDYALLLYFSRNQSKDTLFILLMAIGLAWLILLTLYWYAHKKELEISVIRIIAWAIAFRLFGLFAIPILENDFYRYLWDGYQFATVGSPYLFIPAKYFLNSNVPLFMHAILDQIGYPHTPTIYGPVLQYVFLLSYHIHPGTLWPLKLFFIGADILTLFIIATLTKPRAFLLYAWCPLLIFEVAFNAHTESIAILFLVIAVWLYTKNKTFMSAMSLAFATATKIFALALVPFLLLKNSSRKYQGISLLLFLLALVFLYLPFLLRGSTIVGLTTFIKHWEFNSSGYALLSLLLRAPYNIYFAALLYFAFLMSYFYFSKKRPPFIPRGDIILGVFFLLSPVVNPWYILWLLPFAAIYPYYWNWTVAIVVILAYVTGLNWPALNIPAYNHPGWLRPLEFIPVGFAVLLDFSKWYQARCVQSRNQCREN